MTIAKDEHAAALGRRGGKARLVKMTAEERTRIAKLAAQARWGKKADAPEPPNPNGPGSPDRDRQGAEAGIMLNSRRKAAAAASSVPVSVTTPRRLSAAA
jgi:hypothetical protein